MPRGIVIPFSPRFESVMLSGIKTQTARYHHYGYTGDWFHAFGSMFVVQGVEKAYLYRVAKLSYHKEGFYSPEEFIRFWESVHPERGYRPNDQVFVHRFFRET